MGVSESLAPDLRRRALDEADAILSATTVKERRFRVGALYAFIKSLELAIAAGLDSPGVSGRYRNADGQAMEEIIRYLGGPVPAERLGFTPEAVKAR